MAVVLHDYRTGGPVHTRNPDPDCTCGQTGAAATARTTSSSRTKKVRVAEMQVLAPATTRNEYGEQWCHYDHEAVEPRVTSLRIP